MQYDHKKSIEILERTPTVLNTLLGGIDEEWIMNNEGPDTFSPFDVLGHLIHGEKTDWCPRIKMILEHGTTKTFELYDRFAMYTDNKGKTMPALLQDFEFLRKENLAWLKGLDLQEGDLDKKGMHPELGEVTLKNLLATWVVHDLTHIAQITRVMAIQYKNAIGPWTKFFRIMNFT